MSAPRIATRLGSFDTLRLTFAVLVILSHSFALVRGSAQNEPLAFLTHGQITLGNAGVLAFFVISGFLIAKSWARCPSPVEYLLRRAARIYPAFIVAALVSLIVIVPMAGGSIPRGFQPYAEFAVQTLTLQNFTHLPIFTANTMSNVLNGSLWSVRTEFWCYIGLMLLGMTTLIRRKAVLFVLFVWSICWHLSLIFGYGAAGSRILESLFGSLFDWSNVLPCFLAGMLFHYCGGPVLIHRKYMILAAVALVASNFIPCAFVFTLPICGAYLLMGTAFSTALQPVNLGRFGDFSYGTYLYAFPVQQLIVRQLGTAIRPITLFLIAAPISVFLGLLSWFLVERHFLSWVAVLQHIGRAPGMGDQQYVERHSKTSVSATAD